MPHRAIRDGWRVGGMRVVVMVVVVGGVQQPKILVISWLLHWDDRGTCIASMPPEHLRQKHKHTVQQTNKHPQPARKKLGYKDRNKQKKILRICCS